jgi:2-amino-4-hydroxy-6-hydroxymethyldihydropteridine diphosphokinase
VKLSIHNCIISLASNCCQEENLAEAQRRLSEILFSASYTEAIWTEPFKSSNLSPLSSLHSPLYLNQLVYAQTSLTVDELQARLKQMECEMGRTADDRAKGIVRIDLDLLQYDSNRYHLRDWNRPYVQQLLR